MKISEIHEWLVTQYQPLTLSIPSETVDQLIKNAIRYFNNNSAVRHVEMVNLTGVRTKVSKYVKVVSQVYPATESALSNAYDLPVWTLLGVQVINAQNTDLIMLSETYRNLNVYMGRDFQWSFLPSDDPNDDNGGGHIYTNNAPTGATSLAIIGAKRIFDTDDITDSYILDWILNYSYALVRVSEGNVLRKASIINVSNDGGDMIQEAKDDIARLQEDLTINGRWLSFASRL